MCEDCADRLLYIEKILNNILALEILKRCEEGNIGERDLIINILNISENLKMVQDECDGY